MVCIMALSSATSVSGLNCRWCCAKRESSLRRGSITIRVVPLFTAFLSQLAATGWFTLGLAPITITTSARVTSITGLLTAPEPMPSSSAAHAGRMAQPRAMATLLLPKPSRTSFWKR